MEPCQLLAIGAAEFLILHTLLGYHKVKKRFFSACEIRNTYYC